jgi:hypothetical protein
MWGVSTSKVHQYWSVARTRKKGMISRRFLFILRDNGDHKRNACPRELKGDIPEKHARFGAFPRRIALEATK